MNPPARDDEMSAVGEREGEMEKMRKRRKKVTKKEESVPVELTGK